MPTLDIGGRKIKVDDGFLTLTPEQQNATVEEIAKTLGATPKPDAGAPAAAEQPAAPSPASPAGEKGKKGWLETADDVVRAAANGMTFGLADRFASAAGAVTGIGGKQGDYAGNLEAERKKTDIFGAEHPYISTTANLTGGVLVPLGAIGAASRGATLGAKTLRAAGAGAGLGGAQGAIESRDWTDPGQVITDAAKGAGVGAAVGAAIPGAAKVIGAGVNKVADAFRGHVEGVSRGASDQLVKAMRADTPDAVRAQIDRLGQDSMLVDAGPAFLGKGQGASLNSDEGRSILTNALTARNTATNTRIQDDVNRALGKAEDPQTVSSEIKARRSELDSINYPKALDAAPQVKTAPIMTQLEDMIPQAVGLEQKALTTLRDMLTRYERRPRLDAAGYPQYDSRGFQIWDSVPVNQTDARVLHKVKQELDNVIEYDAPGLGVPASAFRTQQASLKELRYRLNEALEEQVSGYEAANRVSAALARRQEAVELGTKYLGDGKTTASPGRFQTEFDKLEPAAKIDFARGSRGEIERKLGTKSNDLQALRSELQGEGGWNTAKIATVHGNEAADDLMRSVERNLKFRDTYNKVVENSQTAQRQAAAAAMKPSAVKEGDIVTPAGSAVGMVLTAMKRAGVWGYNKATEEARNRARSEVAEILTAQGATRDRHVQAIIDALGKRERHAPASAKTGDMAAITAATIANELLRDHTRKRPQ
jgi:hypothetical protein